MKCKYCGEECGLLKKAHVKCEGGHNSLFVSLKLALDVILNDEDTTKGWEIFIDVISTPFIKQWYDSSNMNLNLQNSERVIWIFENSQYLEKKNTNYQPMIQGIDKGKICLTSKNIYFIGNIRNFKIPFKKLLSIEPVSIDGFKYSLMLQRDADNAKFQYFVADERNESERKLFSMLIYILNMININNLDYYINL